MKVRNEVHTRRSFAEDRGRYYYDKMQHVLKSGNIFTSKSTMKFLQARRIYIHYVNEYQRCQGLPFSE